MKRPFALSVILLASLFTLTTGAGRQQQEKQIKEDQTKVEGQAGIRVDVEQIRVDVTVQDKKGNLLTGLQREHFKVYEDKVEQEITYFEPVAGPMTAVLVTEFSKAIYWEWLYEAWLGSHVFLDQMAQGDFIAVVAYDVRPEILVDFTDNKGEAFNALRKLNSPAFRESNMYDTVYDTLDRIQEIEGRVAIILISSGIDTFSKINLEKMLDKVKSSNVVIYAVSLGGNFRARYELRSGARMTMLQADAALKAMAKYTGGEAYFPRFTSAYPGIFQTIALLLRNQYALGYVSTNPKKDGKFRKIKVEVRADADGDGKDDKLKVRHREGYLTSTS